MCFLLCFIISSYDPDTDTKVYHDYMFILIWKSLGVEKEGPDFVQVSYG